MALSGRDGGQGQLPESGKTATSIKMLAFNCQSIMFFSPIIVIRKERGPAGVRSPMDGL